MRARGMDSGWLADQLGCQPSHISHMRAGRSRPSTILAHSLRHIIGEEHWAYMMGESNRRPQLVQREQLNAQPENKTAPAGV